MDIGHFFRLLGGVALFLFGMDRMGDGLKKVAGSRLEVVLYKLTGTPLKGILLGTGVTAVIQSSSATSVMVVGFVNSGMMKVRQAIGIIMGAIIGTSVTGWVICLSSVRGSGLLALISTDTLTAVMAIVGIYLLLFTKRKVNHHIADILLGFSTLMVGITIMTDSVAPLRESPAFLRLLTGFSSPLIGILIGLLFTCIIQSASAAVGILQALAVTGAVNFGLALPVIMGIAIGASVPVLLSALGANANGRKTAFIYLAVDALGALFFGTIFYTLNAFVHFSFMDRTMDMVSIALLNTVFRVIIVLLLAPLMSIIEKLVDRLVREKNDKPSELRDVERLEERFLKYPALAVDQTRTVIRSMAELACENLNEALKLFEHFSDEGFARTQELEDIVDVYEDKLGSYILRITPNDLTEEQDKLVSMYLHSISDLERISDHAVNLAESAQEMQEKSIVFSPEAAKELTTLLKVIREMLEQTKLVFTTDEPETAYRIAPLEEIVDDLCDEYKMAHVERLQREICTYARGYVFNDMLTDLERVGDHCSNIAIALRIRHGELKERHGSLSRVELEKIHHFDDYYREYMKKFELQ